MEKITIHTDEELNKTVVFFKEHFTITVYFSNKDEKDTMFGGLPLNTSTWQHTLTYWFSVMYCNLRLVCICCL